MRRVTFVVICLGWAAATARAEVRVIIADVPSYTWYYGCGPTAAGMIIGYWDAHGFDSLIDGSNDWDANRQAVEDMVASEGHIRDYWPTPDRQPTPEDPYHDDDCVADFMWCSRNPRPSGASYENHQLYGMTGFAAFRGYGNALGYYMYFGGLQGVFFDEIDDGRPVELYVDSNADGAADHFVTAIGYDDTPGAEMYACYNTHNHDLHWHAFARTESGRGYGIRSGTVFDPGVIPGDADLDGLVGYLDLGRLAGSYDLTGKVWGDGDFNGDRVVDFLDLGALATNYGLATGAEVPIPEPAGTVLLCLGLVASAGRRRRHGQRGPLR